MKKQAGFTLIELVVVIVILGILAAVAIPKFVDLKTEAAEAATKAVAGAAASAAALNYAAYAAGKASATAPSSIDCTNASLNTLMQTPIDSAYTISGTRPSCTVANSNGGASATFTLP